MIEVSLYGRRIGTAEWFAEKGTSVFQYANEIIGAFEPSPILMPTQGQIYETSRDHINFHNLPYLLADSMPDDFGNSMMQAWLRERALSYNQINAVDRLTYVGKRGMGALEFHPADHALEAEGNIVIADLYEIARQVLQSKQEMLYKDLSRQTLIDILRIGTSVGGARAKALLAIKRDHENRILEIRPGDVQQPDGFSYWILKIDGAEESELNKGSSGGKEEYIYYLMAKDCGIQISESELFSENDRHHFLTRRFDRTPAGRKLHMQTLGALAGIDFRQPKASSYETLFRVMKRLRLTYDQFVQQYRRMVFNVIARNHDDHVKNFSFIMQEDGSWGISPAYDICFSYSEGGTWTHDHQTSINGKFNDFIRDDLHSIANLFGIKNPDRIINEVVETVSNFSKYATSVDLPKKRIEEISSLLRLEI